MDNKKDKKLSFQNKVQQILGKMSLNDKINKMASFLADLNGCNTETEKRNIIYLNDLQSAIEWAATFNLGVIKEKAELIFSKYSNLKDTFGIAAVFNINKSTGKTKSEIGGTYGEEQYLVSEIASCLLETAKKINSKNKAFTTLAVPQFNYLSEELADKADERLIKGDYNIILKKVLSDTKYFIVNYSGPVESAKAAIKVFSNILFKEMAYKGNVLFKLCSEKNDINDDEMLDIMEYAVNKGCLLICSNAENLLKEVVKRKTIKEKNVDKLLGNLLTHSRSETNAYQDSVKEAENKDDISSLEESIVMLKNDGLLPLSADSAKKIAVIGPHADFGEIGINGAKTVLAEITDLNKKAETIYATGYSIDKKGDSDESLLSEAVWAAQQADIIILTVGNHGSINANNSLPENQEELIEEMCSIGLPVILLNFSETWVDLSKADELCNCILQCWSQHKKGGEAIAKIIFGEYNPSGRLPVTFYKVGASKYSEERYFEKETVYPFGYGLSYSFVEYYRIYLSEPKIKTGEDITVTVFIKNKGKYAAKETVQAYLKDEQASVQIPRWRLAAFNKVLLLPGEEKKISMKISGEMMKLVNSSGDAIIEPGRFSIYVGGGQPDDITAALYNRDCLHIGFLVE